jgi:predicted nucleotidyltransferase
VTGSLSHDVERELACLAQVWSAVEVLVLFGSATRDELARDSDVDLYVRLAHGASVDGADRTEQNAFASAASAACRREVDLVVESASTSVILRREVAAKGRVLFERRPGAFRQLVVDAVRAYVDLEPQLRTIGTAIRTRAIADGATAVARLLAAEASRGR